MRRLLAKGEEEEEENEFSPINLFVDPCRGGFDFLPEARAIFVGNMHVVRVYKGQFHVLSVKAYVRLNTFNIGFFLDPFTTGYLINSYTIYL